MDTGFLNQTPFRGRYKYYYFWPKIHSILKILYLRKKWWRQIEKKMWSLIGTLKSQFLSHCHALMLNMGLFYYLNVYQRHVPEQSLVLIWAFFVFFYDGLKSRNATVIYCILCADDLLASWCSFAPSLEGNQKLWFFVAEPFFCLPPKI